MASVPSVPTVIGSDWIYSVLSTASAVTAIVGSKIYGEIANQGVAPPYIMIRYLGGSDLIVLGGIRVWSNCLFLVEGMDQVESFKGNLQSLASAIDAALDNQKGTVVGGKVLTCNREQPYQRLETEAGVQWRHLGGFYRTLIQ